LRNFTARDNARQRSLKITERVWEIFYCRLRSTSGKLRLIKSRGVNNAEGSIGEFLSCKLQLESRNIDDEIDVIDKESNGETIAMNVMNENSVIQRDIEMLLSSKLIIDRFQSPPGRSTPCEILRLS
jgi:hypothetical protein